MRADTGLILKVVAFAAEKHRHQRRKDPDASPYINHPIALADVLLHEGGVTDPAVLSAALLARHARGYPDAPRGACMQRFGREVAMHRDGGDGQQEAPEAASARKLQMKHAPLLSTQGQAGEARRQDLQLARRGLSPAATLAAEAADEYFDWAKTVVDGLRGVHPRLEALFDETYARRPAARRWKRHSKPAVRRPRP